MNTRLTNTKHVSLNESIAYINSPQRELDEAHDYALALEEVILALCEELELDPQALVEDIMTTAREKELRGKIAKSGRAADREWNKMKRHVPGKEPRAFKRAYAKSQALGRQYEKEGESHKVYGKGGKVLKRVKTSPAKSTHDIRGKPSRTGAGWAEPIRQD